MKKFLSILLTLTFIVTMVVPAMAEDATGVTEFVNGTEYSWNLVDYSPAYWYVNNGGSTVGSGTGINPSAIAIYKLPLPDLSDGQDIDNYTFRIAETYKKNSMAQYIYVVGLEGNADIWDAKLGKTFNLNDETIKKVMHSTGYKNYIVSEGMEVIKSENDVYNYDINITSYANKKYLEGDNDHFYIGVWSQYTAVMGWNNSHIIKEAQPHVYVTPGERDAVSLALSATSVENGNMGYDETKPVEFYFNKPLASATATLNGQVTPCTIERGAVKIDSALQDATTYTVSVNATDVTGETITSEIMFGTYISEKITQNPYSVSATGASLWTSVNSASYGSYFIYKLPFPKLDPGQKIGKYVFKYYSGKYGATYGRYMKIEQLDEDKITSVTASHPDIAAVIGKTDIPSEYSIQTSASQRSTGFVYETINNADYATIESEVDLTDYANECYNECGGEKDYFLIGVNYRWTTRVYPVTLSAMTSRGYNTLYYATQVPAESMVLEESSVADGDERVGSSIALTFTYNNAVKEITATLNGEEVPCKIDGNHITVDKALNQYTDYQLVLNATDIYNTPSLVSTINFKTGAINEYKDLNTDFEVSFIGPDGKSSETSYHVTQGMSKTAVVKLKIPEFANDENLDRVVFSFHTNGGDGVVAARLDGEAWDVSTLKYSDLSSYLSGAGYVAAYKGATSDNHGSSNYTVHINITDYVKECKDKNQEYAFFALTTPSTIRLYGPAYSGKSSRPYYDYSVSKKTFDIALPKIVAADNSGAYSDATTPEVLDKASSYKAVSSVSNIGNGSRDVAVAIAEYVDDTLVNVEFTVVTVPENASNFDVESKAITLSGEAGKAKAFVWIEADNEPLTLNTVASIN